MSLLRPLLLLQRVRERCARVSLLTGPVQTTDPIGADDSTLRLVLDTATLKKGDSVEIRWEGDWWYLASFQPVGSLVTCSQVFQFLTVSVCGREAEILNIDLNQNRIQVHYVGGSDEEDEWLPCAGHRVQLPPLLEKELSTKREEGKQSTSVAAGSRPGYLCRFLFPTEYLCSAEYLCCSRVPARVPLPLPFPPEYLCSAEYLCFSRVPARVPLLWREEGERREKGGREEGERRERGGSFSFH